MSKENERTSTEGKLLRGGLERLLQYQKSGRLFPQSLQLAPEDACVMDCTFCSTKYRNWNGDIENGKFVPKELKKKKDWGRISYGDVRQVVNRLMQWSTLRTVELTGAGDSIHHPDINKIIPFLSDECGLEVGMITHGVGLSRLVSQENLDKLTWLRCSLATFDPQNFHGNNDGSKSDKYVGRIPDLPERIKGTLGFSYVWGENSKEGVLDRILDHARKYQVDFVRIVPDCLFVEKQKDYKDRMTETVSSYNSKLGKEVFFFQTKRYDVHPNCRIGFLKPFLNADGYFYHCSAVPLYNQKFTEHWRMGHMSEVSKVWNEQELVDTSKCEYGKCFYAGQNELIDQLGSKGVHERFL